MKEYRSLKVLKMLKNLVEEKLSDYVTVEQQGLILVIKPINIDELKDKIAKQLEEELNAFTRGSSQSN